MLLNAIAQSELLRSIPAYHLYLSHGDIVELRWTRMKATHKQDLLVWGLKPTESHAGK